MLIGPVGSAAFTVLIRLPTTFRPMVSEPINSSLFHQLAEQLQQQNLEQFQKQLLEHQQHQQKVLTCSQICFSVISVDVLSSGKNTFFYAL